MRTSSEIIENAIELLQKDGWLQGTFLNECGNRCIRSGLHHVTEENLYLPNLLEDKDVARAEKIVASLLPPSRIEEENKNITLDDYCVIPSRIVTFNDHDGRTFEEVIDVLTEAAKVARNMGD